MNAIKTEDNQARILLKDCLQALQKYIGQDQTTNDLIAQTISDQMALPQLLAVENVMREIQRTDQEAVKKLSELGLVHLVEPRVMNFCDQALKDLDDARQKHTIKSGGT